jgi:drug/metabolite transporter (DMT)-like permease
LSGHGKLSRPAVLALIGAVTLWGSAPVAIRAALPGYAPAQLSLLRFAIASVLLAIYAPFAGIRRPLPQDLPSLILASILGITFYNIILNVGLTTVSAATASFMIAATPIWTVLLAMVLLGERLNILGWSGVLLSFLGIGLIADQGGHGLHFSPGALYILLGTFAYAGYQVMQKKLLVRFNAFEFTCYSCWFGTLLMIPFGRGLLSSVHSAASAATLAVVYLAIFPAAIANVGWTYALSFIPASRMSSFLYLMPVVTLAIGWVWLREVPSLFSLAGGALAIAGVSIVNLWGRATVVPELAQGIGS